MGAKLDGDGAFFFVSNLIGVVSILTMIFGQKIVIVHSSIHVHSNVII